MAGNENSGRPGGNPNIANERKTGPKTKEGKFKVVVSQQSLRADSKSKLLKHFRKCNNCPLRPRTVTRLDGDGNKVSVIIPGKCPSYTPDKKCVVKHETYMQQVDFYYKIGEKMDTLALQEHLSYKMLENAEIAKETEMLENRKPGFFASKFQELAGKNLESLNKLKYGEVHKNENVNINVDLTDTIVNAYEKRKKKNEEEKQKESAVEADVTRHETKKE